MKLLGKAAALLLSAAMAMSVPFGASAEKYYSEEEYSVEYAVPYEAEASSKSDYTLMIYMCGSNLESDMGKATDDINEIIKGYSGKKVNIIIQTGGAESWDYKGISAKKSQRYKVEKGKLKLIDDSLGQKNMAYKNTLSDFIKYCKKKYTAKKYALVMWDHGAGSIHGLINDENYPDDAMELTELYDALKSGGTKFEFIGFDACMMSTMENALAVSKYADYLVASELSEPGDGWYYTDWISTLCKDPGTDTKKLCKKIVDDTLKKSSNDSNIGSTDVSVIDTKKVVSVVLPALDKLSAAGNTMLSKKQYADIAELRYDLALEDSYYEMVDIGQLADAFGELATAKKYAGAVRSAAKKAVVYSKNSHKYSTECGLSVAFPFDDLTNLDTLISIYKKTGYSSEYVEFLKYFANVMAGGQEYYLKNSGSKNKSPYSKCSWYNKKKFYADNYYKKYYLSDDSLELSVNRGKYVLPITEDQSKIISDIAVNLWYYIEDSGVLYELGTDNTFEYDKEGNLIVKFNDNWVNIDGVFVPCYYYKTEVNEGVTEWWSYIPCYYNGKLAYAYVMWDNAYNTYPDNGVLAYWTPYSDDGTPLGKYLPEVGDVIEPYYYAMTSDNKVYSQYMFSDTTITLSSDSYMIYEDTSVLYGRPLIGMQITDIFNNVHYTEYIAA